jgi:hypothetical protein
LSESITSLRHELKRRLLTVRSGGDLDGFVSMAPDDHMKLFFPSASGEAASAFTTLASRFAAVSSCARLSNRM